MSDNEEKKNDWKEREIGALWKKESESQTFLTGKIDASKLTGDTVQIVVFKNNYKEKEAQPDLRMYISKERSPDVGGSAKADSEPLV